MSRYLKLQQLLSEDSILEKLSFYPDPLLDLRSILSEWIEAQDWPEILSSDNTELAAKCEEVFQEALSLLQEKRQNTDYKFYLQNTETKLKKAYQSDPVKFVEELKRCLENEEELFTTMFSGEQPMNCDPSFQPLTMDDLTTCIGNARKLDQKMVQLLKSAFMVLEKWRGDIINRNDTPRDIFGTGATMMSPYSVFTGLKKELEQSSQEAVEELNRLVVGLEPFIRRWKAMQLHDCVSRKVEGEDPGFSRRVEIWCEQVCASVYSLIRCVASKQMQSIFTLLEQNQPYSSSSSSSAVIHSPSIIRSLSMALRDILKKIVERFLVVRKQPPLTMMIEKEKGQKDKEDINNSKKFETTVGILGGRGFEEGINIKEVEIYLAFSKDLAEVQHRNVRPREVFRICHNRSDPMGQSGSRLASASSDSPQLPYERTYEGLRVEQFNRKDSKHVYRQLYNMVYDVKLYFPLFMQEFTTQTISFPIIVRTGANQASEHIGAQLWHSYSSPNVYNLQAEVAPHMQVSQVIQMIDERIKFIGGHGLRQHEKEFLKERLHMAAGAREGGHYVSDAPITLDNFIKDKVSLPRHGTEARDVMGFSLWRWLHSIINLLEDPENLNQPWIEGNIYGFASRQQCISALEGKADGTFLLRFSESVLHGNHTMSKGGLAAVMQTNGQAHFAPPISSDGIEKEGLGNMISSIGGCLYLLGTDLTIDMFREKYPARNPPGNPTSDRYQGWRKQEVIIPTDANIANLGPPTPCLAAPTQRKHPKRPRQKLKAKETVTSKQYRMTSPESPESTISSIASPAAMSPDSHSQFQAVGVQEYQPQMCGELSSSGIPTTVYMMDGNVQERNGMAHPNALNQPLGVNLPDSQVTHYLSNGVNTMDISGSQRSALDDQSSVFSFGPNSMTSFLLDADPNLQSLLEGNGQQPPLSIEDIGEYLLVNTDSVH